MESQASPEFSDYLHAIGRRKALLFGVAIPIAILAILLSVTLPDIYASSGLVEIDDPSGTPTQSLSTLSADNGESDYADQYVQNLKGIVLTDGNLRKLNQELQLYPDLADDETAMLKRLRRDIDVQIVTTPILDPRTGREREVVDAFTVAYNNRVPEKAQKGAKWLVDAFLAEHRRQRQTRASNTAEFYAKEAERVRVHVAQLESKLADFKRANYGQLPELTQVNMTMMDRTEAQIQQNDMQARSLRQERVFLSSQLDQQRSQGPDAAGVRQLEEQYSRMKSTYDESHPDMVAMRRQIDALKYGTAAGAGTSLRSQLTAKRQTLVEARQRYGEEYPDVKKLQRDIATLEARIKAGERADVDQADGSAVGVQLRTQRPREECHRDADGGARVRQCHPRPDHRAREVRAIAGAADGCRGERVGHRGRACRRIPSDLVARFALHSCQAAASGHPAPRPGGRGGARTHCDRGRRSTGSEGSRRARRARAAVGITAGRYPDHSQLPLASQRRVALRRGHGHRRHRRVGGVHGHTNFPLVNE